jgi:hypothetical protein
MVVYCEVKPELLADPLMLGHSGQPLVQEKLQNVVVGKWRPQTYSS